MPVEVDDLSIMQWRCLAVVKSEIKKQEDRREVIGRIQSQHPDAAPERISELLDQHKTVDAVINALKG